MSMQHSESDWKIAILADFAAWLKDLASTPADPAPSPEKRRGLVDLYSEVAALRQEVALQNRTQKKSVVGLDSAMAAVAELGARLRDQTTSANGADARQGEGLESLSVITSFLEIRDSLERTQVLAQGLISPEGVRASAGTDPASFASTLGLVLRKFDRTLEDHGVSRLDTVGMPFDASTMSAVGTCKDPEVRDGTVVEEVRGGFLLRTKVLRTAEVIVNMCNQRGDTDD